MASGQTKLNANINTNRSSGCCEVTGKITSGGGTTDHNRLVNRDLENQHPIEAISNLKETLATLDTNKLNAETAMPLIEEALSSKAKGLFYDAKGELARKSFWYLTSEIDPVTKMGTKESIISGPYDLGMGGGSGGSGGGGVTDVKVTQQDWPGTVVVGANTQISVYWTSTLGEEKTPTGNGTVYLIVNERQVEAKPNQAQGQVSFDVTNYLIAGTNTIQVKVLDLYGTTGLTVGTINAVAFELTSNFDSTVPFTGDITYTYTPYGSVTKTVYFVLDGRTIGTQVVRATGAMQTYKISRNELYHGAHKLEVYFTAVVNGVSVTTDSLVYSLIWYDPKNSTPIIASTFEHDAGKPYSTQQQYYSFSIPYRVYISNKNIFDVQLYLDDTLLNSLSVDTTTQYWEYRSNTAHENPDDFFTMTIACGETKKSFNIYIAPNDLDISPELANQALALSATGRTNAEPEEERSKWEGLAYDSEGNVLPDKINCELLNFNWGSNGWVRDAAGNTILRVSGDARVEIPYYPFTTNYKTTGKTIEFEIATSVVKNYSSTIIECLDGTKTDSYSASPSLVNVEKRPKIYTVGLEFGDDDPNTAEDESKTQKIASKITTTGRHVFSYLNNTWMYQDQAVDLADYGILLSPQLNDEFNFDDSNDEFDFGDEEITLEHELIQNLPLEHNGDNIIVEYSVQARGFYITPQAVNFKSQAASISSQYKENEHIRVSFVIEPVAEHRIIWIYLNGIASGAVQYSTLDNFNQLSPSIIKIGSSEATVDIYNIRIYNVALSSRQIVNNWIADTQDAQTRIARYSHNDNFNDVNQLTIDKIRTSCPDLPQIVWEIDPLPEFKGDKRLGNAIYTESSNKERSFTANRAQYNVQGTSSSVYPTKNIRIKFKAKDDDPDFEWYDGNKDTLTGFPITYPGGIPENYFTFKVDYASSEGANNVELVRLYDDIVKERNWLTPPQKQDGRVRVGIDGFPIIAFHQDANGNIIFSSKANFNNDKANEDTYGFATGDESWEITNNSSDLAKFKTPVTKANFSEAFEIRFPDQEGYGEGDGELDKLIEMTTWLASTNREAATGKKLPVTYTSSYTDVQLKGGKENSVTTVVSEKFDYDTPEYRLAKFKTELPNYFDVQSSLMYYIFTATFLMIDSRAKNAFPTYYKSRVQGDGGNRWFWLPYDMDTAIGIDNKGKLVFDYNLEDTDTLNGAFIYNGQDSVMWTNIRDAYSGELATLYADLRTSQVSGKPSLLSYANVESMFEAHQGKWSENIFNEDAYNKYVVPLESGTNYLEMLQGSKAEQRKWWLYNRFKYMDSKYLAGDAKQTYMQFRAYIESGVEKPDITITPYADIYATISWANGRLTSTRAKRNEPAIVKNPLTTEETMNDQEVYIYSVDQIKSFGDLSPFKPDTINLSNALKLQDIKVGDGASTYINNMLTTLALSANTLLKTIDVRNCPNLNHVIDASQCVNIEEIYLEGSSAPAVNLPEGGNLKKVHLSDKLTTLKIKNHPAITDLQLASIQNLTSIWLENTPLDKFKLGTKIAEEEKHTVGEETTYTKLAQYEYAATTLWDILGQLQTGAQLRLIGINEKVSSVDDLKNMYDKLDMMQGIDFNGDYTKKAQVTGKVRLYKYDEGLGQDVAVPISYSDFVALSERYPEITIEAPIIICQVSFMNDGVLHAAQNVRQYTTALQPSAPAKTSSQQFDYEFSHWELADGTTWTTSTTISEDTIVTAIYKEIIRQYTATFITDSDLILVTKPSSGSITQDYGTLLEQPSVEGEPLEGETPTAALVGWFLPSGTKWEFENHTLTDNITLTARWQDTTKPILSVDRLAFNKVLLTASDNIGIAGWAMVKDTQEAPTMWNVFETAQDFIEEELTINSAGTYYFWVKDRNDIMASISKTAYTIQNTCAVGVSGLILLEDTNTIEDFAFDGTRFVVTATLDEHYKDLVIGINESSWNNGDIYTITGPTHIEVDCAPRAYVVNFNTGRAELSEASQTVTYLHYAERPLARYLNGYIISNWSLHPEGAAERPVWDFNTSQVEGPTELYAIWEEYNEPTKITITIPEDSNTESYPVTINFSQIYANSVMIDFGDTLDEHGNPIQHLECSEDGESSESSSATYTQTSLTHAYPAAGKYEIKVFGTPKGFKLGHSTATLTTGHVIEPSTYVTKLDFAWDISEVVQYAFINANNLKELVLTPYLKEISTAAFANCFKLASVSIPEGLMLIRGQAFENCTSLKTIMIPKTVQNIYHAFSGCTALEEVIFADGVVVNADGTIAPRVIEAKAFLGLPALKYIKLGEGISTIQTQAFAECPLLQGDLMGVITLPSSIETLGTAVFNESGRGQGCGLVTIKFPETEKFTAIPSTFANGSGIQTITIPENVKNIYQYAFANCVKLRKVVLLNPELNFELAEDLANSVFTAPFGGCMLLNSAGPIHESYTAGDGSLHIYEAGENDSYNIEFAWVTKIPDYAFSSFIIGGATGYSQLYSVTLPASITELGAYAFRGADLRDGITLPADITSIGEGAFSYSNLRSIEIPSKVSHIGANVFSYSRDTSLTITFRNSSVCSQCMVQAVENSWFMGCFDANGNPTVANIYIPATDQSGEFNLTMYGTYWNVYMYNAATGDVFKLDAKTHPIPITV
jgi:hypothetical protein